MINIQQARIAAGLSRAEACRLTLVPLRTMEDWEASRNPVPPYVERWLLNEYKIFKQRAKRHKK